MIKKNIVFFATRDWILSRFFASQLNHFIEKKYNVYAVCKITDKKNLSNFKNLITININVHKTNINFITLISEIYTANKVISSLKPNRLNNGTFSFCALQSQTAIFTAASKDEIPFN